MTAIPFPQQRSTLQPYSQRNQTCISRNTQCRQNHHRIPTGPKFLPPQPILPHLTKKLLLPFISPIHAHQQHPRTVCRKQRADGIEFRREDLEHYQRERELAQRGADVRSFECPLRGADFHQSVFRGTNS